MKHLVFFWTAMSLVLSCSSAEARDKEALSPSRWEHSLDTSLYIFKDDFFMLPIYRTNTGWLHLEARYNYEDKKTFSGWFGYNFNGGSKFQYNITPIVGGIAGKTDGIAPGLELTFNFCRFELYSESEYVFDLQNGEDSYFYMWTDLTYSPLDWLWFGLSAQRTRLYQTDLDVQRGLIIGGGYRWFRLTAYLYNLGFDDPYVIITLSVSFPE